MNDPETRLHFPLGRQLPPPGAAVAVAEGVKWIRMGLPFALDHINLWLLRDRIDGRDGWTVVDCGIASDDTRARWASVFAHELDGLPVLRVVVTHMHPDHVGLAHWLCEHWSTPERPCRLWISATDYYAARVGSHSSTGYGGERAAAFFASHGLLDHAAQAQVRERSGYYAHMVPAVPPQFCRLMDGMDLTIGAHRWRCIAGHGHAPEHMALHCDTLGLLISGDMLLPRISTNVSVFEGEPEGDPLPLFLASIARLAELPAHTLVLPSHGRPFVGAAERTRQLQQHHDERLAQVQAACAQAPRSAADLLPLLFRPGLDLHQTTFAMGEALAHLHALWHEGRVSRTRGADGVWRFASA